MLEEPEENMDSLLDEALTGGKDTKKPAEKKSFEDEALDAKVDPSVFKPEDDDAEKPKKKKKVVEEDDAEEEEVKPKKKKKILDSVLQAEADEEQEGWLPAYTPPYKQATSAPEEEGEGSSVVLSKYGKRYAGYDDAQTGVSSDEMGDIMRSQKGTDDSVDYPLDMPEPSMTGKKKKAKVSNLSLFDDDEDEKPSKGKKSKKSISDKLLGAGDSYDDQADDLLSETLDKDLEKAEKKKAAKKAQKEADEEAQEEIFDEAISEIPSKKKTKSKKDKKPVKESTLLEAISEPDNL